MKGIWIPVELIDLNVSWLKRILLSEISQLETLDNGCTASNNHFAEKYNITKQAVSKALNELEKEGFISINNAQSKRNFGRKLTINFGVSAINFRKSAINFGVSGVNVGLQSKGKKPIKKPVKNNIRKFCKPKREQISEYLQEKQQQMDIDYFIDYYESKDWMIGKNKMKNWKSAVNNWLRNNKKFEVRNNEKLSTYESPADRVNRINQEAFDV